MSILEIVGTVFGVAVLWYVLIRIGSHAWFMSKKHFEERNSHHE